ncbi:MAG TPA: hypothetical protein VIJ93_05630, partial [bacterium]
MTSFVRKTLLCFWAFFGFGSFLPPLAQGQTISTIAGGGPISFIGNGGPATLASLGQPDALAFDSKGNLYIADPGYLLIR